MDAKGWDWGKSLSAQTSEGILEGDVTVLYLHCLVVPQLCACQTS